MKITSSLLSYPEILLFAPSIGRCRYFSLYDTLPVDCNYYQTIFFSPQTVLKPMNSSNAIRLASRRIVGKGFQQHTKSFSTTTALASSATSHTGNVRKVFMASVGVAAAVAVLQEREEVK
jgi:hypothetical protein